MAWSAVKAPGEHPFPRFDHCSVAFGNRVFVFGGSKDRNTDFQNDITVLDTGIVIHFYCRKQ